MEIALVLSSGQPTGFDANHLSGRAARASISTLSVISLFDQSFAGGMGHIPYAVFG